MNIEDLQGKLVAVLGYGQEGKAVTNYLIEHGLSPVLFDQKPWEEWEEDEQIEIKALGLNFIFGPDCFKELTGFSVAFRSPGIRLDNINLIGWIKKGLIITSQTKWFFEHCPSKIIGVTGTKGKGTTCSLIYEILKYRRPVYTHKATKKYQRASIYLTGNIGKAQPLEFLDDLVSNDYVVYELSSFQLQDLTQSPQIAVVLMVTQEHLDYHKNIEEYIEAKSSITKFQTPKDAAVINADYKLSMQIGKLSKGGKLFFSRTREVTQGVHALNGSIWLDELEGLVAISILKTLELQLKGEHNLENVCAAIATAKLVGVDDLTIREAVINFKGLEHRLEFVTEKQGIKFYNDSFSTTPETAIAAVNAFTEPLITILGGSSKNSDFTQLGKTIAAKKNIKSVILVGVEGGKIKSSIEEAGGNNINFQKAENMEEIFNQIKSIAQKGDVVLLSPACASFGMFENYVDRGNQFKQAALNF